jgi:hypothetical protein
MHKLIPLAFTLRLVPPPLHPLVLASISGFFNGLNRDVIGFALAEAAFAFALAGAFYIMSGITGNERHRQYAATALYAALAGLAFAFLSNTIAQLVSNAAAGQ